ncbi:hypothetical protein RRG08_060691 [Elysia crispata]|uniref:Uncharacterized protein n=1 Tax=Elysia crispata TaxID=231223 RepID=A0AAE1D3F5_9GAST|nr:hypothetical protein RRG08_060691 [Elysia crispata]
MAKEIPRFKSRSEIGDSKRVAVELGDEYEARGRKPTQVLANISGNSVLGVLCPCPTTARLGQIQPNRDKSSFNSSGIWPRFHPFVQ